MLSSEIVVVEWRPAESMPRLASLIPKWMVRGNNAGDFDCQPESMPPIRVISVADDVADTALPAFGAAKDMPLLQWHCKAAGLRRASGEFLAVTNADDIWSPELFHFLSAVQWFRTDSFFVTHTVDAQHINEGPYPFYQIYDEIFSRNFEWKQNLALYMQKLKARYPVINRDASRLICLQGDTLPMEFRKEEFSWFWELYDDGFGIRLGLSDPLSDPGAPPCTKRFWNLFDATPGDFIMAPRHAWHLIAGPPMLAQNMFVDYLIVCRFATFLRQVVISEPCFMYHQAHDRTIQKREPPTNNSELTFANMWERCCDPFRPFASEHGFNVSEWGFDGWRLPETIVFANRKGDYLVKEMF